MRDRGDVLRELLPAVSRTFSLSLRVLPATLREPVGLAYLLARAADTVADTRLIARADRLAHLETLRRACLGEAADVAAVAHACAPRQTDVAERRLLERVDEALARVAALAPDDRDRVRGVLATLTDGMRFDLTRFPGEDASTLAALDTVEELDHYTYLVAGCVGDFWTRIHVAHRPRLRAWNVDVMSAWGVRFGKALQMTNVLRDVPADLRAGRCYLPARELEPLGLRPADLLDPSASERVRPLLRRLLELTLEHYEIAWRYTLAIPRLEVRMRLACVWPLMIGLGTLAELAARPRPLEPGRPAKISRAAVRAILGRSALGVWSNHALAGAAARARDRIDRRTVAPRA